MSPYDKCISCGSEMTTGGCVNFACPAKLIVHPVPIPPVLDGATTALHRRIEELTAELERERADHCWEDCCCRDAAAKDLATERAAREQLAELVGQALVIPTLGPGEELSAPKDHALIGAMLVMRAAREQAESVDSDGVPWRVCAEAAEKALLSERAEVARLREELVKWQLAFGFIEADEALDDCATKLATERAERAKEFDEWATKLAAERAAREQAEKDYAELRSRISDARFHRKQAERERDTALARVKELERALEKAVMSSGASAVNDGLRRDLASALERLKELEALQGCATDQEIEDAELRAELEERAEAAETALASARELLERVERLASSPVEEKGVYAAIVAWLTSHPYPAPVPWDTEHPGRCSECDPSFGCFNGSASCCKVPVDADVCGKKCDHGSECLLLRGHEGGHDTQHGCTFYDAAPAAAPCAERLADYLEAAARDLPLEQFLLTMRRKLLDVDPIAVPCAGCAARDAAVLESVELLSDVLTSSEPRAAARRALACLRAARKALKEHP